MSKATSSTVPLTNTFLHTYRNPITNTSLSTYSATNEEIEQCFLYPELEDEKLLIGLKESEKFPEYSIASEGWCEKCNRAYHRTCDDKFQQLVSKYQIQYDKENPDSVKNAMTLCNIPSDTTNLSDNDVSDLKEKITDTLNASSDCYKLRVNHHKNCVINTTTNIKEPDPSHKEWLEKIGRLRNTCSTSLKKLRKQKPKVGSRPTMLVRKLKSKSRPRKRSLRKKSNKKYK